MVAIVSVPTLPTWWPPSGYEEIGDDPIQIWPTTIKQLTGRRLGYFDAIKVAHLAARDRDETVSVAIGLRPDRRLAILEGTPERRQQEWQVWEG